MRTGIPWLLALFALAVSLIAVVPLFYIVFRALSVDLATWQRLWVGQMPDLLVQSAALLVGTIAFTLVVGIAAFSTNGLLRGLARVYVELIRNIPLLLQLVSCLCLPSWRCSVLFDDNSKFMLKLTDFLIIA